MISYRIKGHIVSAFKVIAIGDEVPNELPTEVTSQEWGYKPIPRGPAGVTAWPYREVTLENGSVVIIANNQIPVLGIGDYVRYDIGCDDYVLHEFADFKKYEILRTPAPTYEHHSTASVKRL